MRNDKISAGENFFDSNICIYQILKNWVYHKFFIQILNTDTLFVIFLLSELEFSLT